MADKKVNADAPVKEEASTNKKDQNVTGLEDDDEFEEFPVQEWTGKESTEEDDDLNVWEDNWDDESVENDFSKQLREELLKNGHKSVPL
uniref:26S proteasome complex subunit dss-1 n=1 Tax=Steinernema glaseri TaxID=37863 RepID=A0A1I8A2P4_9BILA